MNAPEKPSAEPARDEAPAGRATPPVFHAPLNDLRELKPHSFVFARDDALPAWICDDMVERFERASDEHQPGRVGQNAEVRDDIKKSTDLLISGKPHWKDVDNNLHRSLGLALRDFRETFPYFKGPFKDLGYGIQRTLPGEYYDWHIDGGSHEFSQRQLVAIWYLNDVEGPGGETCFFTQDVVVKPRKGLLILFPPFWTHEHRGATLKKGVKYIATTWITFA